MYKRNFGSEMEPLHFRVGSEQDSYLLAKMNRQLIHDEGHRNSMAYSELESRMRLWLQQEYEVMHGLYTVIHSQRIAPHSEVFNTPEVGTVAYTL